MPDLRALAEAVARSPADDAPRLAYARAAGGPLGAWIRLEVARARLPPGDPRDAALARRAAPLEEALRPTWKGAHGFAFDRGFPVAASVTGFDLVADQGRVLSRYPTLRRLGLVTPDARQLRFALALPGLARLERLEVAGWIGPEAHRVLLTSEAAARLPEVEAAFTPAQLPLLEKHRLRVRRLGGFGFTPAQLRRALAALPELEELVFDHAALTRAHLEVIAPHAPRLRRLQLFAAGLRDADLQPLLRAGPGLRELMLLENPLTGAALAELVRRPVGARIETLHLGFDALGDGVAQAGRLPALRRLRAAGVTPARLEALLRHCAERLESLELLQCPLGAEGARVLAKAPLRALRRLALPQCQLDAAALAALASAPALAGLLELALPHNPAGDAGVEALRRSPHLGRLRRLDLEFCRFGEAGGRALAGWPKSAGLSALVVNGNHVLDPKVQQALMDRFWPGMKPFPVARIGYQHPWPDPNAKPEPVEPEPVQRKRPKAPPRRRDWRRGLSELVGRPHFATWDGYVDAPLIAAAERVLDETAEALLALGEAAPAPRQRAALKRCIQRLNRLDAKHGFIQTIEREDVMEAFDLLARYTKLAGEEGLGDAWRDF